MKLSQPPHINPLPLQSKLLQYGSVLFGVGVLIAIIGALIQLSEGATKITVGILIFFGILVGALNITRSEATSFMVASLVLVILLGQFFLLTGQYFFPAQSEALVKMLTFLNAMIIPAALVVALKTFFFTAKDR